MNEKRKTAAELIAELGSDPEHQAMLARKEEERKQLLEERDRAARPIVEALRAAGVNVQGVADLLDGRKLDPAIISILLEHVKRLEYPDQIREMLLRALGSPVARPYWDELVALFEQNAAHLPPAIHYVAAIALDGAFSHEAIDDLLRLVKDPRLGHARAPLLFTLKRSKDPRAKMLLLELRDDPSIGGEVKRMRRLDRKRDGAAG
ncbi:hypothetical protein [Lysobacter sp. Root667]|uniref:hypothetical protein n=1 Tax=Lysobacter sp. Root667 TaxID=1736581 RepID=UPI0012DE07C3|nr:hypothetical protein [Lysobacter sp. Root667]